MAGVLQTARSHAHFALLYIFSAHLYIFFQKGIELCLESTDIHGKAD